MMDNTFTTMRLIEIDAAHRVPEHGSKCRVLHGHRYRIECHCIGALAEQGEQKGMTIDFSFIKEGLIRYIHEPCDHGLILRFDDPLVLKLGGSRAEEAIEQIKQGASYADIFDFSQATKMYIIKETPTAEVLAKHWFDRLQRWVAERSDSRASLLKIVVFETPNCCASYPG
jgi:6-pyruvoyltetrahydropterin/6-carboxytetrahydropterin synthase